MTQLQYSTLLLNCYTAAMICAPDENRWMAITGVVLFGSFALYFLWRNRP